MTQRLLSNSTSEGEWWEERVDGVAATSTTADIPPAGAAGKASR